MADETFTNSTVAGGAHAIIDHEYHLTDSLEIVGAEGLLAEPEASINKKLLGLIIIIYLSMQVNSRLQRKVPSHFYRGEHGLCLIFGLLAGCVFQLLMTDEEVKDLLYSQAIVFKLMLVPIIFYDQAFNVNHGRPGNVLNCVTAVLCSIVVSVLMSLIFYFIPGELLDLQLPYTECLILALSLSTVDTDTSSVDQSKTMSLVTNTVILLLVQFLSNPASVDNEENQDSAGQIIVMMMKQTLVPLFIAVIFSLFTILPLRMRLATYVTRVTHQNDDAKLETGAGETIETEFDMVVMMVIPATAFLVAEAAGTSGTLALVPLCFWLRLYAKPNLTKERAYLMRIIVTQLTHISKQIAYTLMGFSLPLHFKHTQTSYVLACVAIFVLPVFTWVCYFVLTRFFRKRSVVNWYRCASESGLVAYMLALLTFQFKVMHLVLLVSCTSFIILDKVILLILRCAYLSEYGM